MPVHDWTRVEAGIFHDFHSAWITELRNALNAGLLPTNYYARGCDFAASLGNGDGANVVADADPAQLGRLDQDILAVGVDPNRQRP